MSYTKPTRRTRNDRMGSTKAPYLVRINEEKEYFEVVDDLDDPIATFPFTPGSIKSHLVAHHQACSYMEGWNQAVRDLPFKKKTRQKVEEAA